MTSVSAVVVHFRGAAELDRCMASCLGTEEIVEVVLVDNEGVASRLRERYRDRRVRVLAMGSNVGYGRAANVGLDAASGDASLVLNQDVEITDGAVASMLRAGERTDAWLVGPRLVDASGTEAPLKDRFPAPLGWTDRRGSGEGWREVPWLAGAAVLFMPGHTDLRFDPRIFMYAEDEELCWRVWRDGGRVVLAEDARVVHQGGTAAGARWSPGAIAARTVWNRARFVGWHAGRSAAVAFTLSEIRARAARVAALRAAPYDRRTGSTG